jgi:AcrR family transcriptional regulator
MAQRPLDTPRATQRRRDLLDVGFEFFADHDYDNVQIGEVAKRAGVSHGLIFQHFGSKKGFYLALLEDQLEQFTAETLLPDELPPAEQLAASLRRYVEWAAEHPRGYVSLMRGTERFSEVRELVEASRWEGIDRIAGGAGADLDDARVRVALRGWVGFMESAIIEWLEHGDAIGAGELVEALAGALVAALMQAGVQPLS